MFRDKQVVEYVQKRLPAASEDKILERNKRKRELRGAKSTKKIESHYYYPVFSNHLYGYQVDLLQQSNEADGNGVDNDPDDIAQGANNKRRHYFPFFLIAINTNTKYTYAYHMLNKSRKEIIAALVDLYRDTGGRINSIRCDEEAGLDSRDVNNWCKARNISIKSIRNQNHTSLSVVDRVIRTLRDMNTPVEKSKRTSLHQKYRDFTPQRMQKLLKIYNSTTHKATGMKPKEMQKDSEDPEQQNGGQGLERKYILKKLYESERRHKISDYTLPINSYVKYIVPRDGKKKSKHRYRITREYYQIHKKDGHAYVLMAQDGSTATMTRWRLIPVRDRTGLKWARSIGKGNTGVMDKITGYVGRWRKNKTDAHEPHYLVSWKNPTNAEIITHEPVAQFKRDRTAPHTLLPIEKKYWDEAHQNVPKKVL
jgi:uncharacterized protein YdaU (DUF1376 family)